VDLHTHLLDEPGYANALAETARALGFDAMCLSGGHSRYGLADNEDVLKQTDTYPDLFVPVGALDLRTDGPGQVENLAEAGFRALKVMTPPEPYDRERFYPVYEAAQSLDMPVMFHTGYMPRSRMDAALDISCEPMRPVYLDGVARRFPGLKIIGTGLGFPWCAEAVETMRYNPNVYFDLSGELLEHKDPAFFRDAFGSGRSNGLGTRRRTSVWPRVMFGSAVQAEHIEGVERDYRRLFRSLAIDEDTREAVMGGTARQLLQRG
jgi:hypothetical protein